MKRTPILLLLPCMLVACTKVSVPEAEEPGKPYEAISLTKAETQMTAGVNTFGIDLFKACYEAKDRMISPLSVSLALSMAAYGASGDTERRICDALGFEGFTKGELASYYRKVIDAFVNADNKTELRFANSIWSNKGKCTVLPSYREGVAEYYYSEANTLDFSDPSSKDVINGWVSDRTNGRIPQLLSYLDPSGPMVLVNATYFSGKWQEKFEKMPSLQTFRSIDGNETKVEMMTKTDILKYSSYDGYEMAVLPYGNGSFQMDLILFPDDKPFAEGLEAFSAERYLSLMARSNFYELTVAMPMFSYKTDFDSFENQLRKYGLDMDGLTDFSEMCEEKVIFNKVIHKTFIDVNLTGTEAVAATALMMFGSAGPTTYEKRALCADRPFVYIIREQSTGTILFIGQRVQALE